MTPITIRNLGRRHFLRGVAGLTLGVHLPAGAAPAGPGAAGALAFEPNAFLRIGSDDSVTVISKHLEMGQGTYTGLATIVAEELDADWSRVRVEAAPADAKRYNNLFWGPTQGTGGSTAMANSWEQLRKAGASARAMLVAAAARRWQVPAGEIEVREGRLKHPASGRSASFGELAGAAAEEAVPAEPRLKSPRDFRLIGRRVARKDSPAKTDGSAQFTQDLRLPGMLVAVVAHPPRFGARLKAMDDAAARALPGVRRVVRIPSGVAVLASDTWSAKRGRDALKLEWDERHAFRLSTAQIFERYHESAQRPGTPVRNYGDAERAIAGAVRVIEAGYDFPYLAHAAMEPMNCVVRLGPSGCEVWNGEQLHTGDQHALARLFGITPEQVTIHTLFAGGSFGRRACKDSDYVLEAAQIAKAIAGAAPVKLVWMREDDMRAGYYRPAFHHRLRAGLDDRGRIVGWSHRLVGQSILEGSPFAAMMKDGIDPLSVEGAANLPYDIENLHVDLHTPEDIGVPVLWWRSVGSTHTAFSTETFLDRLAEAADKDPVALRLELLGSHPRHAEVLKLAAEKAGWGRPLAPGAPGLRRGRGVAVHSSFRSYVAQVAEVSVQPDGAYHVDRVVCAVDCGIAINPDNVRAQIEGAVAYALSAAAHGAITLADGQVEQSNFHDYAPIRIDEMPRVEVHIVESPEAPTGIGEPGVPPLAPAVANALAAATGVRLTRMPFDFSLLKVHA